MQIVANIRSKEESGKKVLTDNIKKLSQAGKAKLFSQTNYIRISLLNINPLTSTLSNYERAN